MKFYLAAKYSRHPEMREFRGSLELRGHTVTSRWINGGHEVQDSNEDSDRARFAMEDLADLDAADVVIWFAEPEKIEGRNRGGRHVEFGYALAKGIPIYVVGRRENIFHWIPSVMHCSYRSMPC